MKNFKRILSMLIAFLLVFTIVGCSGDANKNSNIKKEFPMELTDVMGNKITLDKAPEKIVSVSPTNTEILFALGLNSKVVGVTNFCNYPKEALSKEKIGDYTNINIEKVIELKPDIVLCENAPADKVKILNDAGILVFGVKYESLDDIYHNILLFGAMNNKYSEATKIVDNMKAEKEKLLTDVDNYLAKNKDAKGKKVFLDLGDFYTVSDNTFLGIMIKELKATNIMGKSEVLWPEASLEYVVEKNPNIYISFSYDKAYILKNNALKNIDAFKNDGFSYVVPGSLEADMIMRPGPRSIEGMKILAKMIYSGL